MEYNNIKTGDIALISYKSGWSNFQRMFIGSEWNDVSLFLRKNGDGTIVVSDGELYVLKCGKGGYECVKFDNDLLDKCNHVCYRPLDDKYRCSRFMVKIKKFYDDYIISCNAFRNAFRRQDASSNACRSRGHSNVSVVHTLLSELFGHTGKIKHSSFDKTHDPLDANYYKPEIEIYRSKQNWEEILGIIIVYTIIWIIFWYLTENYFMIS